ncbi:metallophosphoesterase family protein [Jannaschia seohaensis]|uniref:Serine/threonine protein phosphatase 1 n=1 Tax=Jannaschia seohaensis TaxID=475081 RepID=A0A2Y9B597_9RHOB|nr:metallophosphoesterase family protein [Jannaschia seohaensis]PWJ12880.1 serine/threonine protein phosphatase 1 [Jannaschia seohaensis]SSA50688.1 serine/threonine protein phosphatase 1 [Jannaschia seohaensis]
MPDHPAPERPVYAVGDLHGRADLLAEMLALIEADAAGGPEAVTVFLGDYVDRGPDARATLDALRALDPARTVCLMGNHERMLLDALDRPGERGDRWLTHGGMETLASYGLGALFDPEEIAMRLRAALPPGTEAWLRGLPATWRSGDVVCVHAALDPVLALDAQDPRVLLWGRPPRRARRDGLWVVHGHTVVDAPELAGRRVAVDTGAWASGRLTAAAIFPGAPIRFLQVGA